MGKVAIVINVETLKSLSARANANQPFAVLLFCELGRFTFFADLGSASQIAVAPAPFPPLFLSLMRGHPQMMLVGYSL